MKQTFATLTPAKEKITITMEIHLARDVFIAKMTTQLPILHKLVCQLMDSPFMVIISMKALKMDSQMILTTAQVTIMTAMAITIMLTMSTLVETIIGQNIDLDQVIAGLEIFQRYLTFGSQEEKVNR